MSRFEARALVTVKSLVALAVIFGLVMTLTGGLMISTGDEIWINVVAAAGFAFGAAGFLAMAVIVAVVIKEL